MLEVAHVTMVNTDHIKPIASDIKDTVSISNKSNFLDFSMFSLVSSYFADWFSNDDNDLYQKRKERNVQSTSGN